jgi:hypothetical protein
MRFTARFFSPVNEISRNMEAARVVCLYAGRIIRQIIFQLTDMNAATHSSKTKFIALLSVMAGLAFLEAAVASQAGAQTLTGTIITGTSTNATTTLDQAAMQSRIFQLEAEVDMLQAELSALRMQFQAFLGTNGTSTATSTTDTGNNTGAATTSQWIKITPENSSSRAGTNIDFNGRGFWADEQVTITMDGQLIGSARADSQGNFSTGSITVPRSSGSYTYTFRGDWSGMMGTASVNVDR